MPQAALGNNNLYYTFAKWTQPSVSGDSHYTNYQNAPDTSFWGGTGVSQLVQAGADSIATSTPQYRFWTEDYPLGTVWEGPVVRPGDTVGEAEQYSGSLCNNCGGTATFWLENYTTGYYQSFTNSAPYPGWQAANFINERLGSYYLPKFGSTVFTSCTTNNGSGIYWYLTTSNNNRVYMTTNGSSSGTVMSDPGAVNNSTNGFTDTWKNAGP